MPTTMIDLGEAPNGHRYYKMKNGNFAPALVLEDGSYIVAHQVRGTGCNLNKRCADAWIKQNEKELNARDARNKRLRAKLENRKRMKEWHKGWEAIYGVGADFSYDGPVSEPGWTSVYDPTFERWIVTPPKPEPKQPETKNKTRKKKKKKKKKGKKKR